MALDGNSSPKSNWKYHVFLSFRGEDTRFGFTDHLHAALKRKSIITFRDNEELERGEVISQKLLHAIEDSLSAIVIISQNYAASTWCLDELQKIVESKQRLGREVFPVFYGVDPSDVRHQRGSFAEAFRKHEEKFAENKAKVKKWRDSLKDISNLSGWDSKYQYETELIEDITAQVWTKLEPKLPTYNDGLVAMETKVNHLYSHLRLNLQDVCFIGIWGMGGIGKTTLATIVFKKIKSQFEVSCFLANVREASKEGDQGLIHLQNKLLSHLKLKGMTNETPDQGKDSIKNLLFNKKVLLVLDDVSAKSQLENLAGNLEWFGPGSRIIVTTRDKHLLISHGVLFEMYEIKILNTNESLQLFSKKAFNGDNPKENYLELSKNVVKYAGGLPLALEVLGSSLCQRSVHEWEEALIKISQVPHDDILSKLKISFDMLEEEHKTIFLDIACFYKGWYKDKVTKILESCGLYSTIGINVLIEKSLITRDGSSLGMHDLLEEMGKSIVFQEYPINPRDPIRHSRLWSLKDIDQVIQKNTGTEKVHGIVLKSSIKSYEAHWDSKAFYKMTKLRVLIILCDLLLPLGLKCLSSSLKVLIWMGYPFKALPLSVQLDELVHLQLSNSKVKKLWNGRKLFRNLKVIDLTNSEDLIQTPNISGVPNLEKLFLDGCISLVEVHQSVGQHKKLAVLSFIRCTNLESFPSKLEMSSLTTLFLSGCSKVQRLPDFGENMECLSVLNLMDGKKLLCLPNTINNLKSLRILNMSGCSKVWRMPCSIIENQALEDLDLSRTSIREVNSFLLHLQNLKRLSFSGCSGSARNPRGIPLPQSLILPPFISGLSSLTTLDLSFCNLNFELIPKDLGHLSSLERLILTGNNLAFDAANIASLSKLRCRGIQNYEVGARNMLPPHARISSFSSGVEASLLDVWKLFESRDSELIESPENEPHHSDYWEHHFFETPPRFDNQSFFPMGSRLSKHDSSASIIVDIPDECRAGEWWGIAVFITFEPPGVANIRELRATLLELRTFRSRSWGPPYTSPEPGL